MHALNRPTSTTTPDSSEIRPGYNEAGLLERVDVRVRGADDWTVFVKDIDYDAKGQREQIVYGEDTSGDGRVTTEYTYDPLTFRMTQLKTMRASDDAVLQNLAYTYDPVGNITEIKDSAQQTVFFNNDVVLPTMAYVYDALYRLTEATGRELTAITAYVPDLDDVPVNLPHANDTNAVRNYTQNYVYDGVGNILQMIHKVAGETEWTRHYKYATDGSDLPISNRLLATSAFADADDFSATYGCDAHGNMTSMPHLASIGWNHRDEMVSADKGGGGMVYFTYDSAGQRVRKVYEHSGLIEERIYLGGFEVYRKKVASTGVVTVERGTLHVMDGVRRIALVETKTIDTDISEFTPVTVVRVQLGNHLGSVALEVDLTGLVISYEEYHPYGTTAYQSASSAVEVSRKRYRYTGKERDEETGLYYHGARYYAPWLGRWTAADPAGLVDGPNVYAYVCSNPVHLLDPSGMAGDDGADGQQFVSQTADGGFVKANGDVVYGPYDEHAAAAPASQASDMKPQAKKTTPSQAPDGLLASASRLFKRIEDHFKLADALDDGDFDAPIVKEHQYSQEALEHIDNQRTFNHVMDTWAEFGIAGVDYAGAWGLAEIGSIIGAAEESRLVAKETRALTTDPVLDSSVFTTILAGDAEAIAFANANRGLLVVDRITIREALKTHSRTAVRDALRDYNIAKIGGTLADIEASAQAALRLTSAAKVNNDLRIIGSTKLAGIPAVVTGDKQFALRAAQNNLQVYLRQFDRTMGPVDRIIYLGRAEEKLDAALKGGELTRAQRALIDIQ